MEKSYCAPPESLIPGPPIGGSAGERFDFEAAGRVLTGNGLSGGPGVLYRNNRSLGYSDDSVWVAASHFLLAESPKAN